MKIKATKDITAGVTALCRVQDPLNEEICDPTIKEVGGTKMCGCRLREAV